MRLPLRKIWAIIMPSFTTRAQSFQATLERVTVSTPHHEEVIATKRTLFQVSAVNAVVIGAASPAPLPPLRLAIPLPADRHPCQPPSSLSLSPSLHPVRIRLARNLFESRMRRRI
jgi:hypothetical protein